MLSETSPALVAILTSSHPKAVLALADGSAWTGHSIGASGQTVGEVVFNTSMSGYQEILTDASYCQQIVTLTYPHIGNTGVNSQDAESRKIFAAGLVIKDLSLVVSNFRSQADLSGHLKRENTVAIAGLDTRALTRILREKGAQNGCILALPLGEDVTQTHVDAAISSAQAAPSMSGLDLARVVSVDQSFEWTQTEWQLALPCPKPDATGQPAQPNGPGFGEQTSPKFHVVAYDFGIKFNILRMLAQRGCRVTVVPAQTSAADVLDMRPNGVFLSNGPGDPEPCDYAISAVRTIVDSGMPTFGICLGHQIMALASGAKTFKMKFGHHGANHPVKNLRTGQVSITSQNHGFAVQESSLPAQLSVTHVSLFDGTIQGLIRTDKPAFSFQGHPEASPGPHDIAYLFDQFIALMEARKNA